MKVRTQIVIIALLRIILNTMHRMVYPFLTVFARGLGVDVTAVSLALAGRNIAGIFGPIVAPVADLRGRKFGMLLGIVTFTLGVGLVAVRPSLPTFVAALVLGILGKSWFDPAVHAYFGDRVAYEQRGTAVAVTEMSWSIAFIVGVPAMGFLIAHYGWSAPFPILTVLGVFMLVVIWWVIPRDRATAERQSLFPNVQAVLASVPALAGILIGLWASGANEMVNLNFGVWLADAFKLQIAALAGASAVIGIAELSGESSRGDRHGPAGQAAGGGTGTGLQYRGVAAAAIDRPDRIRRAGRPIPLLPVIRVSGGEPAADDDRGGAGGEGNRDRAQFRGVWDRPVAGRAAVHVHLCTARLPGRYRGCRAFRHLRAAGFGRDAAEDRRAAAPDRLAEADT